MIRIGKKVSSHERLVFLSQLERAITLLAEAIL